MSYEDEGSNAAAEEGCGVLIIVAAILVGFAIIALLAMYGPVGG